MKPLKIALVIGLLFLVTRKGNAAGNSSSNLTFAPVVYPQIIRNDNLGQGHFGASRDGGSRQHKGTDLVANFGQQVFSPIKGIVNRKIQVYPDDTRFTGCEITGTDEYTGFKVKLFYMIPESIGQTVTPGEYLGFAQAISEKYSPSMIDHIHVEFYFNGEVVNPANFLKLNA